MKGVPILLGTLGDEKVQLGEHNSVEIEKWEASVSLTIPKWIFPYEECRWMMEQWRRQLSRIMSCGRGCAQGEGGSNATTWKSSHLCQQGASSAQVFWSILKKGHSDMIYSEFCTVMSPLWSRDRSGNILLHSKCRVLETVPTKALFHWFPTTCVGGGSKAVARSGPLSQGWPVSVVGSLHRDGSGCRGTAAQQQVIKSCPTRPGPCCAFPPPHPLRDPCAAPSKGNVQIPNLALSGMQIPSSFMCVQGGGRGVALQL